MTKQKNIGIESNVPKDKCTDRKCPYHGSTKLRGRSFVGTLVSKDTHNSAVVEWDRIVKIPKYERTEKRKSKATKIVVKEIRFGPQTDEHDYQFKKKHAEKFLNEGAKLKAFVFFKGRSIIFKEQGQILLLRLAQDLEGLGTVEQLPQLEGKRMIMFIMPKKN